MKAFGLIFLALALVAVGCSDSNGGTIGSGGTVGSGGAGGVEPPGPCMEDADCTVADTICLSGNCILGGACTTTTVDPTDPNTDNSNLDAICLNDGAHWNAANTDCGTFCVGVGLCVTNCLQNIPNQFIAYPAVDPAVNNACATCYGNQTGCISQWCIWRLEDGVTNCELGDSGCAPTGPCAPPNDPLGQGCTDCQVDNGCPAAFAGCAGDPSAACTALGTDPG